MIKIALQYSQVKFSVAVCSCRKLVFFTAKIAEGHEKLSVPSTVIMFTTLPQIF